MSGCGGEVRRMDGEFEQPDDEQADELYGEMPDGPAEEEEVERAYDLKALFKYGILISGLSALIHFSGGRATPLVTMLAIFAMIRRKTIELMFFVMYLALLGIGSDKVFCRSPFAMITTRSTLVFVTGLLAMKVFNSPRTRIMTPICGIMWYIGWEVVSSLQGYAPLVSLMKLALFTCIFLGMYGVAKEVSASTRANAKILRSAMLVVAGVVTVGSALLIPFPAISLMEKLDIDAQIAGEVMSLFCGVASHSQTMGPLAAILGTFLFADLAFSVRKWDLLYLAALLACPIIVYKTSSRTAMGTLLAGWGFVAFMILHSRGIEERWKRRLVTMGVMVLIFAAVVGILKPGLREKAVDFVLKRTGAGADREQVTVETVMSSRQGLIEEAKYGFSRKPIIGNGFQVSAAMAHEHRSGLKDYIAAPIEKGVWFYAIPEEGGIIGMTLFCAWLLFFFSTMLRRRAYVMAGTFFTFMVANCGEFSLFSMTYVGGFSWVLVLAAGVLDAARNRDQGEEIYFAPTIDIQDRVGFDEWERLRG